MRYGKCPGCGEEKILNAVIELKDNSEHLEVCEECGEFLNDSDKGISLVQVCNIKNPVVTTGLGSPIIHSFWPDYPASI